MVDLAMTRHVTEGDGSAATAAIDLDVVERARRGDLEAFDAIVVWFEPRLLRFLIGLVGDVGVAQELCQDTFLAAYRALPRTTGEMKLSAWLHTIALNKARSHHRRRKWTMVVSIDDHDQPAAIPDLQDAVASREAVREALGRIPRQYAEVLLLQISSGLSCREIASIVGSSEGAVKVKLMRAREAFKRAYEHGGGE